MLQFVPSRGTGFGLASDSYANLPEEPFTDRESAAVDADKGPRHFTTRKKVKLTLMSRLTTRQRRLRAFALR